MYVFWAWITEKNADGVHPPAFFELKRLTRKLNR